MILFSGILPYESNENFLDSDLPLSLRHLGSDSLPVHKEAVQTNAQVSWAWLSSHTFILVPDSLPPVHCFCLFHLSKLILGEQQPKSFPPIFLFPFLKNFIEVASSTGAPVEFFLFLSSCPNHGGTGQRSRGMPFARRSSWEPQVGRSAKTTSNHQSAREGTHSLDG